MSLRVRVGMLGCGVVGGGVAQALQQNGRWMDERHGLKFDITHVAVRDLQRDRGPAVKRAWLTDDWHDVCMANDVDVVVEVMGGIEPADEAIRTALSSGKHVVTANKALLAVRGDALRRIAEQHNVALLYEASVLAGVPVLHGLANYFKANRITMLRGIVNGTCNYILTRMDEEKCDFATALAEAQRLGYAEADPTQDIASMDAMYKLEILIRQAFSVQVLHGQMEYTGIGHVSLSDMSLARQLGCRIQQVAHAQRTDGVIRAGVGPALVPSADPLSHVRGVDNALCIDADIVGRVTYSGPGAGAYPTASAVIEDLIQAATSSKPQSVLPEACSVIPNEAHTYFVRHHCERPRAWLGPLAAGSMLGVQTKIGAYVRTDDGHAEGWVISTTREGLSEMLASLRDFDGRSLAWFPFSSPPSLHSIRRVPDNRFSGASV